MAERVFSKSETLGSVPITTKEKKKGGDLAVMCVQWTMWVIELFLSLQKVLLDGATAKCQSVVRLLQIIYN